MDKFTKELDEAVGKMLEYDHLVMKKPREYGCGIQLYMSDIHMIEAIENHPHNNLTQLAEHCGLTKGTVSKLTQKLERRGLILRYQYLNNKKESYFVLTEQGKCAYEGHYKFHEQKSNHTHNEYKKYSKDEKTLILDFIKMYTEYLKDYI